MSVIGRVLSISSLRQARMGSFLVLIALASIGSYAVLDTNARQGGITGQTQKTTNAGCSCHCSSANSATSVGLTTATTIFYPGTSATFTVTVSNSSEAGGGIDIAAYSGSLTAGSGLYLSSGELTHSSPQTFDASHTATWQFTYTAPSTAGWDTIYATGNAVNLNGQNGNGDCSDKWNWASKYIIQVLPQPRRLALGRPSIAFGQLRVGRRKADSLLVTSTGTFSITINSEAMKTGSQLGYVAPGSNGRTLNAGASEVDSVIFAPTSRGTFSDSLIFTTNSDTIPDQRKGIAVSGQGIQAVFSSSSSTLAFGNLRMNQTGLLPLPFSNTGDDTLFLQTPTISGSGFTISQQPHVLTLPPGIWDTVIVQFAPTSRVGYTGTLSFAALNGVTTPSIALSGNGVAPQVQSTTPALLGSVRVGQPLQGTITIKNTGNDVLHITSPALTQSGTKFTLGTYDATIAAGATGSFHLTYTPTAEKTDTAALQFTSDDPSSASVSITVLASGTLPHMLLGEIDTVVIGQVKVGGLVTRDIAIYNTGGADLTLNAVTVSPTPPFTVSSQNYVTAGGTVYATISFSPASVGIFDGVFTVSGDDPKYPTESLFIRGSGINSALSITPATVSFGSVAVSKTAFDTILLSNSGTASVNILGYKLSSYAAFGIIDSSVHQIAPGATAKLVLSFTPAGPIAYNGTLTLTTDEATPTRVVNVSGIGVKGALSVLPSSIDFGPIDTGMSSTMTVSVHNTGTAAIQISGISINPTGSAFSYTTKTTLPTSLAAGDSLDADVTFAPRSGGEQIGALSITLADNTTSSVALHGSGVVKASSNSVRAEDAILTGLAIAPNPSHGSSTCTLTLARPDQVHLAVIDPLGREVMVQDLGMLSEGSHQIELTTPGLAAGVYFVRVECAGAPSMQSQFILER
ncbi:MAG: choice-of-anchor D domain-containing protein [Bacteroidota bacterium]|nr:choice-of-anchor D domain-containing protein [Bacteroidota bacterium]MDP4232387.1 choice-of-anchor D domain-containing protein [Bacteroidota bacterium]MDP4241524.1 choice-of-anchor D domain-containing protein [Bacteroidota bacterium]MDP4288258.1 choice-of-anchor D domain-containing protein [Bacteroidota bacterium]